MFWGVKVGPCCCCCCTVAAAEMVIGTVDVKNKILVVSSVADSPSSLVSSTFKCIYEIAFLMLCKN